MKTKKLDYKYPSELIAEHPVSPRDSARLMVVNRNSKKIAESAFSEIDQFLKKGDLVVFNKSKVFPARISARKDNGRSVEVLFLAEKRDHLWEVLVGGRVKDGEALDLGHGITVKVLKKDNTCLKTSLSKKEVYDFLVKYGSVPLPPYIKRRATAEDAKDYQNVFADAIGSAAAPTAGLHFTKSLIAKLKDKGVEIEYVTLHVGLGTFAPIKTERVEDHRIHTEYFEIDRETKSKILDAKNNGRRIIACGTTALRVLESLNFDEGSQKGESDIYIYPGYHFRLVDGLITNFHTPRSSLLALVYAFGGERLMRRVYRRAIKRRYRLFSYGDGMFIS